MKNDDNHETLNIKHNRKAAASDANTSTPLANLSMSRGRDKVHGRTNSTHYEYIISILI